jgi:hypothetical protein
MKKQPLDEKILDQLRLYPILSKSLLLILNTNKRSADIDKAVADLINAGKIQTAVSLRIPHAVQIYFLTETSDLVHQLLQLTQQTTTPTPSALPLD